MTDSLVSARHILHSQQRLVREGASAVLEALEATEPELAEYLFETLSHLYSQLSLLHASAKRTQKLYRQVQELLLIVILSLRQAQQDLWKELLPREASDAPASSASSASSAAFLSSLPPHVTEGGDDTI